MDISNLTITQIQNYVDALEKEAAEFYKPRKKKKQEISVSKEEAIQLLLDWAEKEWSSKLKWEALSSYLQEDYESMEFEQLLEELEAVAPEENIYYSIKEIR